MAQTTGTHKNPRSGWERFHFQITPIELEAPAPDPFRGSEEGKQDGLHSFRFLHFKFLLLLWRELAKRIAFPFLRDLAQLIAQTQLFGTLRHSQWFGFPLADSFLECDIGIFHRSVTANRFLDACSLRHHRFRSVASTIKVAHGLSEGARRLNAHGRGRLTARAIGFYNKKECCHARGIDLRNEVVTAKEAS